jgi:acyl carrier protein
MEGEDVKQVVLERVRSRGKLAAFEGELRDDTRLDTLGIDSMGIISLLIEFEKEIGLDFDRVTRVTPPKTLSDLVGLALQGCGLGTSEPIRRDILE